LHKEVLESAEKTVFRSLITPLPALSTAGRRRQGLQKMIPQIFLYPVVALKTDAIT